MFRLVLKVHYELFGMKNKTIIGFSQGVIRLGPHSAICIILQIILSLNNC